MNKKELIKQIKDLIKLEKECMGNDEYSEQIIEHTIAIDTYKLCLILIKELEE